MDTAHATSLARSNLTACIRCRRKKRKCDHQLPSCGLCAAAGEECVGYDAVARRNVPRRSEDLIHNQREVLAEFHQSSYVLSLEERVAYLELELRRAGVQYNDFEASPRSRRIAETDESRQSENLAASGERDDHSLEDIHGSAKEGGEGVLDEVQDLLQLDRGREFAFSKIILTGLMTPAPRRQPDHDRSLPEIRMGQFPCNVLDDLETTTPMSLPTTQAAETLVKTYFLFTNQGMPLLHEPSFRQKLQVLYNLPTVIDIENNQTTIESKLAVFFVLSVFAVALVAMQRQNPSQISIGVADRYHKTALHALRAAGLPSGVEGVQALLLIAQFSYHHPTHWYVRKTIGAAMLLAVELGLHEEADSQAFDVLTLDIRRRVFWVAYSMERNISAALSLPLCLSDGAITAKYPVEADDEYITADGFTTSTDHRSWAKSISNHLFRYRRLQSEMRTMLYEGSSPVAACPQDLRSWQKDLHNRIQEWYQERPRGDDLNDYEKQDIESFELSFYWALLYLYTPTANLHSNDENTLAIIADASISLINLYRKYFRELRLTVYWLAIEGLRSAGTSLLYAYVHSPRLRERVTAHKLESLVHTCSSVLWGMVEHFPAFKDRRDAFEIVASRTLADLAVNSAYADRLTEPHDFTIMSALPNHNNGDINVNRGPSEGNQFANEMNLESDFYEMSTTEDQLLTQMGSDAIFAVPDLTQAHSMFDVGHSDGDFAVSGMVGSVNGLSNEYLRIASLCNSHSST